MILCLAVLVPPQIARAEGAIEVSVNGGLVDLTIGESVPLTDVLDRLAVMFATSVEGDAGSATVEPLRRTRLTLVQTLSVIAPGRSFMVKMSDHGDKIERIVFVGGKGGQDANQNSISKVDDAGEASEAETEAEEENEPANAGGLRDIVKLTYRRDQVSLNALKAIARKKGETSLRVAAIRALGGYAELGAVPFLGSRLTSDPSPEIRLAAAEALVQINTARSREFIARAVKLERNAALRQHLQSLAEMLPETEEGSSETGQVQE